MTDLPLVTREESSTTDAGSSTALPTVSVVICAYTEARWDDLGAAVDSVRVQHPDELLVVIDHNTALRQRTERLVADGTWAGVTVLANAERRGLSGARNTGVSAAQGDVVAFLDDDACAEPGWLAALRQGYTDPSVQGVGGLVEPRWPGERPGWFPAEFDWVVGCSHSGMPSQVAAVRNFVGANMSLRRSTLILLGGFHAELGRTGADVAGCEETELCIRAGALTATSWLRYDPAVRVRHTVTAERTTWRYFLRRCRGEGRSKATVSRLAGTGAGLSSERDYLRRTIPAGVLRALRAVAAGDRAGLPRAAAIVAGVAATVVGYVQARVAMSLTRSR